MRRVAAYVHVAGRVFGPGDQVPDDVAERITNPAAWSTDPVAPGAGLTGPAAAPADPNPEPVRAAVPPMTGAGSGREEWAAYAHAHDVPVPDGAKRGEIVQALRDAGVLTEQP